MQDTTPFGLEGYFEWKKRKRIQPGLASSLLAPYWDDLAAAIFAKSYTWHTVRRTIEIAKRFAAHCEAQGVCDVSGLTKERVRDFLKKRPLREGRNCLRILLSFLHDRGVLQAPSDSPVVPSLDLLDDYLGFLREHRGIGAGTIAAHSRQVQVFLQTLGEPTKSTLKTIDAPVVSRFVTSHAATLTRSQRKIMCAALRAFLRFLHLRGCTERDLSATVPVIPSFKLDRVPEALERNDISKILSVVDRSTPVGRRDYALLLVLATYGIRGGQLCALRLDDIDWRRNTIRVCAAKGGRDALLPLQTAVGEAIVDYLHHGRPPWPFRELFLRVRAPMGPLRGNLVGMIRPYARKAGVTAPHIGPRAWRHACATRLLSEGHSLKTISDMLGHRTIETTFIYTKVDVEMLRSAALDWPEVKL